MFLPPVAETFFIKEASEASAFSFEYHITFLLHLLKRKPTVTFTNIFTLSADINKFGGCPIVDSLHRKVKLGENGPKTQQGQFSPSTDWVKNENLE